MPSERLARGVRGGMNEKYSQAGSNGLAPAPPLRGPAVGDPQDPGCSGPPPPTLATQLNNGDIAGRAAAPRPPLPLTRAYPWACGWPGAGSGAAGCGRASSRDGGRAAGSTPPRASLPERASPPGSQKGKWGGGRARGRGWTWSGAPPTTPPDGHAHRSAHPDLLTREVGMCKGRPLWTSAVLDPW